MEHQVYPKGETMDGRLLAEIRDRYACRAFLPDGVDDGDLRLVLEAGRLAPSAFGLEPWRFVVVDAERRAAVEHAAFAQPAVVSAPLLVAIAALVDALHPDSDYVRARFVAEARGEPIDGIEAAYRAFYRPERIAAWAIGQCNFAAAHMLLQATHLGLASCPVGGFDDALLAQALGLPAGETPALLIALGHCAHAQPERLRKPL
jgi:nitroreductase